MAKAVERKVNRAHMPRSAKSAGQQEYLADPTKGVPADAVLKRIKSWRGASKPE